jgi:glutaredoxin
MSSATRCRFLGFAFSIGVVAVAACDRAAPDAATESAPAAAGAQDRAITVPEGWESLDEGGGAQRLYYQFVDDRGAVRFVERLGDVPEAWRDRVGFVKLDSPPPLSPRQAQALRSRRSERNGVGQINAARERYAEQIAQREPGARETAAEPAPEADAPELVDSLVMYSADWCPVCQRAKAYLDERGIDYEERDIDDADYEAELVEKTGRRAIPVFDYDGRILSGFRPETLARLLEG